MNDDRHADAVNGACVLPPAPGIHLQSAVTRHAMNVQQAVLTAARAFLRVSGFIELLPPVIGPVTDPGVRGSKQLEVGYYGYRYRLMTSAILYKQASLLGFPKLFYIAANVRAEQVETAHTGRHLAEFHQIDVEFAGASREQVQRVAESLVKACVAGALANAADDLAALGRDRAAFAELLAEPFDVCTHADAVATLADLGHTQNPDGEIDWTGEVLLSHTATKPFFVNDYPKGSRGFYDRENPSSPGSLYSFDLIAPEGFGEVMSGSEREYEYARIVTRMRETGENPAKYGWYLDLVRAGIPASAGFGLGLQRLVRYITGLDALWKVSAYPKVPGVEAP